jgi:hypothetical protein
MTGVADEVGDVLTSAVMAYATEGIALTQSDPNARTVRASAA